MSRFSTRGLLLASILTLSLNGAGQAADVTEAQAKDLAARLQAWASGLLANRVTIPPGAVSVTPDGRNYRIALPIAPDAMRLTDTAGKPLDALVTSVARPLDDTRWRIESIMLPANGTLGPRAVEALKQMRPGGDPAAEFHIRSYTASGVHDTAQATESRIEYRMEGLTYTLHDINAAGETKVDIDKVDGALSLAPSRGGMLDFKMDEAYEAYKTSFTTPQLGHVRFAAPRVTAHMEANGIDSAKMTALIPGVVLLYGDTEAGRTAPLDGTPRKDRMDSEALFSLVKNLLTGIALRGGAEDIDLDVAGTPVSAGRFLIEFGGESPADILSAYMRIALDDLKIGDLPPEFAGLIPRVADLRISVSNLDLKGLTALAKDALDPAADPRAMNDRLAALLAQGKPVLGVDQVLIDLGFATLKGAGQAIYVGFGKNGVTAPVLAEGQVTVTGLDALMERAGTLPNADQVLPVLALIKGLGKADGDRMVWNLRFDENYQLLVNGVDISKMGGNPR